MTSRLPLVLVENEITVDKRYEDWQDVTGKRYHFPNVYKNLITEGRQFIYYRGERRHTTRRAVPEYFGCGTLGRIERDDSIPLTAPKKDWKWFGTVEDYTPFEHPVPFRLNGKYIETCKGLGWGRPRQIPEETYRLILELAGVEISDGSVPPNVTPFLPNLATVRVTVIPDGQTLLSTSVPRSANGRVSTAGRPRRTKRSTVIGRRAEEVALEHLRNALAPSVAASLKWVANEGRTPGWDIEYVADGAGDLNAVEVKGTTAAIFDGIDITANEWEAAKRLRENYVLLLVGRCLSDRPLIQYIPDPCAVIDVPESLMRATPDLTIQWGHGAVPCTPGRQFASQLVGTIRPSCIRLHACPPA